MSADLTPFLDEAPLQWRETVFRFLEKHCAPEYVRAWPEVADACHARAQGDSVEIAFRDVPADRASLE
jgi:hypothetical protein